MTLTITVEDGTGVSNANAYESVADTETRLDDLNLTTFGGLTADQKAAALFRGTQDVEQRIRPHLTGKKTTEAQGLSYPRTMSYYKDRIAETDAIPLDLLMACAYAAAAEAQRISDGDAERTRAGVKRSKVPGSEVEYFDSAASRSMAALIDDRAAPHVRALISRRRAA